jgi:catechol 2,3-dioxygenase-like lactoylglutathione lyase family enzyme
MMITNALASVAVNNVEDAAKWYARLLDRSGNRPMAEVAEWQFEGGGGLQVYELPERAGSGSFTAAVADVDEVAARLDDLGIEHPEPTHGDAVDTLMIVDPDGNHIAFAAAHDGELAR